MEENCIFCEIANKTRESQLYYEDSNFVIFEDIHPVSSLHYLVVTKSHIKNGRHLKAEHIEMINEMKRIGLEFIKSKGAQESDVRMGFHWPPFNSISHLHMHVIYPISQMSCLSKLIYKNGTFWFVEVDDLIKWLSTQ